MELLYHPVPEITPLPFEPGRVVYTDSEHKHGLIWLYQADAIHPDNLTMPVEVLRSASLAEGAEVYLDHNHIGGAREIYFDHGRRGLMLRFRVDVNDIPPLPEAHVLLGVANLDVLGVRCPICGMQFERGSTACACIWRAPCLQIDRIRVIAVQIYDGRHDIKEKLDTRADLLRQYFAGAVGTLHLMEPL